MPTLPGGFRHASRGIARASGVSIPFVFVKDGVRTEVDPGGVPLRGIYVEAEAEVTAGTGQDARQVIDTVPTLTYAASDLPVLPARKDVFEFDDGPYVVQIAKPRAGGMVEVILTPCRR